MKKYIFTLLLGLLVLPVGYAQDLSDALRYATNKQYGSARYTAMSGAFGALGGDLSGIAANPAGSAVFLNSRFAATLNRSATTLQDNTINNRFANLQFGHVGGVFVFDNADEESAFKKFTFALNYNQNNDFKQTFRSQTNRNTSIANYFLDQASPLNLSFLPKEEELENYFNEPNSFVQDNFIDLGYQFLGEVESFAAQQAFIGLESYIINPDNTDPNNTTYSSNVPSGILDQTTTATSTGFGGQFGINLATQINDNVYIGINLNAPFFSHDRNIRYSESIKNTPTTGTTDILFENNTSSTGSGFSINLGGILKATEHIRIGLAYESPTWYTIQEETTQFLRSNRLEADATDPAIITNEFVTIAPNIVNVYPEYQLKTPGKLTASAAVIFGKLGLLSFDYAIKDFSAMKYSTFGDSDTDFSSQNKLITDTFTTAASYRIGGELRQKNWRFRGGLSYKESPYESDLGIGDTTGISLGLGYDWGKYKLDVAYAQENQEFDESTISSSSFSNTSRLERLTNTVTATFVINL